NSLQDRVRLLGHALVEELPALYSGAELLAYPSSYEGFGLPIAEALACNTPVVACTGSCLEEAGGPGGLYVPPGEVEPLREALRQVLEDSALARDLAAKGREYVQRFGLETVSKELMGTYSAL
ncbi:MAG: glycosyltransferase, partial [Desulfovibrio sp.]